MDPSMTHKSSAPQPRGKIDKHFALASAGAELLARFDGELASRAQTMLARGHSGIASLGSLRSHTCRLVAPSGSSAVSAIALLFAGKQTSVGSSIYAYMA
jgi:hypothetical protein